mmetsp:Transcript_26672/g.57865  ORF Transcript_26672/g.57865 Transcript_26672/m.57865 type:complete len:207 (+) Transcript_26672:178-798(+)
MSAVSSLLLFLGCVFFRTDVANAFVACNVLPSSSSSLSSRIVVLASPLAEDALACFPYEFRPDDSTESRRSMIDISERQALTAFEELARLYGEERAVDMVKVQPLALAANSTDFEPAFEVWSETFGPEATQSMVARNPGLLLISSKGAEMDKFGAMGWSYFIWATRPVLVKLALAACVLYRYDSIATSEDGIPSWILHASDNLQGM